MWRPAGRPRWPCAGRRGPHRRPALPGREDPRDGKSPGDVAGIAGEFGPDVDHHHFARLHAAGVLLVMKNERVGSGPDDRGKARPGGCPAPPSLFDHALQVGFQHARPQRRHPRQDSAPGDVDGPGHKADFGHILDHAQGVKEGSQVVATNAGLSRQQSLDGQAARVEIGGIGRRVGVREIDVAIEG